METIRAANADLKQDLLDRIALLDVDRGHVCRQAKVYLNFWNNWNFEAGRIPTPRTLIRVVRAIEALEDEREQQAS